MTLIGIIRKYLTVSMLIVLVIGCISYFFIFRLFIYYSIDQSLNDQRKKIENYVASHDSLPLAATLILEPARIETHRIPPTTTYPNEVFKDTTLYSGETGRFMPYRQLFFVSSFKGEKYLININQPAIQYDDLLYAILSSLLLLVILFMSFIYIINFLLKRNIWKPLNKNLQKLYNYDLKANTKLQLEESNIKEFDEINEVIMRMVKKINEDYENYRFFTEDASHEMQTPLSIIKSKLDLLLQEKALEDNNKQLQSINAMSKAVIRLSKLNRSLLLIARINNNQYTDTENVSIDALIKNYLEDLEEIIQSKELVVKQDIQPCHIKINPSLAEILISNLLNNAIKHNIPNGKIDITLNQSSLVISNNCQTVVGRKVNLFNRIVSYTESKDSSGLGLNIVQSICNKNNIDATYEYPEDTIFRIKLLFSK